MQLCEEEDDATSALADGAVPKPEPDAQGHQIGASVLFQEVDFLLELFCFSYVLEFFFFFDKYFSYVLLLLLLFLFL